jgi:phosphohistidine phosphatase
MKRLLLMRHGHSPVSFDVDDHDRPLSTKGQDDVQYMAALLEENQMTPERMLVSSATRTQQSANELQRCWLGGSVPQETHPTLYLSGLFSIQRVVESIPASIHTILLLGHNPGWSQSIAHLSGVDTLLDPGNIAILEHDAPTWSAAIQSMDWRLATVLRRSRL